MTGGQQIFEEIAYHHLDAVAFRLINQALPRQPATAAASSKSVPRKPVCWRSMRRRISSATATVKDAPVLAEVIAGDQGFGWTCNKRFDPFRECAGSSAEKPPSWRLGGITPERIASSN